MEATFSENALSIEKSMRYFVIIFSGLIVFVASCKKENGSGNAPEMSNYSFSETKKIIITDITLAALPDTMPLSQDSVYRYEVADGNNLVFKYSYYFKDLAGLGNQAERTIVFQIPPAATSFDLHDSTSLLKAKALVHFNCGECFGGVWFLTNGYIRGTKLNESTWLVEAAVSSPLFSDLSYSFKEKFTRN